MKSSSIFSFDALAALPRPTRAVVVALALFCAVRLILAATSEALFYIPENDFDKLYLMNETQYRVNGPESPELIVVGTSRLGILSMGCIAARAGVDPSQAANFSLAGNSYWRTLLFFRRNPDILKEVKVVIIDLLPYQIYLGRLFTEEDELFLRHATLHERWQVLDPVSRAKAFADLVFPVWSERHSPAAWFAGLKLIPMDPLERCKAFRETVRHAASEIDLRTEVQEMDAATTPDKARGYAPPPAVSAIQVESLERLMGLLPEDCLLVLAWLPVREDYADAFLSDPELNASYARFKAFIENLEGPQLRKVWLDNTESQYMQDQDFTDVVHFSPSGAEKICTILGDAIAR